MEQRLANSKEWRGICRLPLHTKEVFCLALKDSQKIQPAKMLTAERKNVWRRFQRRTRSAGRVSFARALDLTNRVPTKRKSRSTSKDEKTGRAATRGEEKEVVEIECPGNEQQVAR